MEGEVVALTVEGCKGCEELKKSVEEKGLKLKFMDVSKDNLATYVAMKLEVYEVPTLVFLKKSSEGVEACRLDESFKPKNCVKISREEVEKVERGEVA